MNTRDLLSALRSQDYRAANKAFAMVMQAKLADRLVEEKQAILNEGSLNEGGSGPCQNVDCHHPQLLHEAGFGACSECDCEHYEKTFAESTLPTHEVQRVYDETHDTLETEILCGVKNLKINDQGQVIAFVAEASGWTCKHCGHHASDKDKRCPDCNQSARPKLTEAIGDPNTSGQGYDIDYHKNPYHGIIRKYGYEYSHSTPVTVNGVKGIRHTYAQHLSGSASHYVGVFGNSWDTSSTNGVASPKYGSHPNTARSGADLERHLSDKAHKFNLTEGRFDTPIPAYMKSSTLFTVGDRVKPSDAAIQKDLDYAYKLGRSHPKYSVFMDAVKKRAAKRGTVVDSGYNGYALGAAVKWDDGTESEAMNHMLMPADKSRLNLNEDWANGQEDNGYVCFYQGKRIEVYASSSYGAQKKAAAQLKVPEKKQHQITVTLAELGGKPVTHVATESFESYTNAGIVERVKDLADEAKVWIDKARWAAIRAETKKGTHRYDWAKDMSDSDMEQQLFDVNDTSLRVLDKKKYILIDVGKPGGSMSGRLMVNKENGAVHGVKAYGVIHPVKRGDIDTMTGKELARLCLGSWESHWVDKV